MHRLGTKERLQLLGYTFRLLIKLKHKKMMSNRKPVMMQCITGFQILFGISAEPFMGDLSSRKAAIFEALF